MPAELNYPGVYVEEVRSGVRTIMGVATSITAFVGRTRRGPCDEPTMVHSTTEFERLFGEVWSESPLSYAVRQYFLNGGRDALIVRVQKDGKKASVSVPDSASPLFKLEAISEGSWGDKITAQVDFNTADRGAASQKASPPDPLRFRLQIERVENVGSPQETVLASESWLVSVDPGSPFFIGEVLRDSMLVSLPDDKAALETMFKDKIRLKEAKSIVADLTTSLTAGLELEAQAAGTPGQTLTLKAKHPDTKIRIAVTPEPLLSSSLFNLTLLLRDDSGAVVQREEFRNLSLDEKHPRYVAEVLAAGSRLARVPEGGSKRADAAAMTAWTASNKQPPKFTMGQDGSAIDPTAVGRGLRALEKADQFNLLCIPPLSWDIEINDWGDAVRLCEKKKAILLIDAPKAWKDAADASRNMGGANPPCSSANAAVYYPWIKMSDPLSEDRLTDFPPCGAVAGVIARTDSERGIWKAPAGLNATVLGARGLQVPLTDADQGLLNPLGLNCLRSLPVAGTVVWGARTARGADRLADEYKYLPVRRVALHIEESLYRGLQWVVFEPNDEPLWAQIRLNVGSFMQDLFRKGAFQGTSAREAYLVKCDRETTTKDDVARGVVNILVGFAPLRPAEFVVLKLTQLAGQAQA